MTTYTYDSIGNKLTETLPSGEVTTYGYDDLNRLTSQAEVQGGTTIFSQAYALNDDGTRATSHEVQKQANGSSVTVDTTWTYDADGRLTDEAVASSKADESYADHFAFDLAGNRVHKTHDDVDDSKDDAIAYEYNKDDQLTKETSTLAGKTDYGYDANGSLKTSTHGSDVTRYAYDLRNKMASFTAPDGTTTAYAYNEDGNRVSETTGSSTTLYLTDSNNPTGYAQPIEEKSSGSPTRTYLVGDRVYGQADASGNVTYLLTDGHGSTQALTSATGTISSTYRYDAFGGAIGFTPNSAATEFLFGGDAIYDPRSGLYLHGDGVRGRTDFRFIEADELGRENNDDPTSLHKYAYANLDPVNYDDVSGYSATSNTLLGTAVHSFLNRAFEGYTPVKPGFPALGGAPGARLSRGPSISGSLERWSNRRISTIAARYGKRGSTNISRPDFVEVNTASVPAAGDLYELKPISTVDLATGRSLSVALDLAFYGLGLNATIPNIIWSLGRSWIPGLTVWPSFTSPLMPKGEILITYSNYVVAPGAVFYDVVGIKDVGELAAAAAAGVLAATTITLASVAAASSYATVATAVVGQASVAAGAEIAGSIGLSSAFRLAA